MWAHLVGGAHQTIARRCSRRCTGNLHIPGCKHSIQRAPCPLLPTHLVVLVQRGPARGAALPVLVLQAVVLDDVVVVLVEAAGQWERVVAAKQG